MARLRWLIIPVFVFFLMSHNASAVVKPVVDLNQYDFVGNYSQSFDCNYSDSSLNKTNVYNCPLTEGVYLRNIFANQRFNLKKGDIITFDIVIYSNDNFALTFNLKNYYWAVPVQFDVLDIDILDNNYYHQYWAEDSLTSDGYAINQVWRFTVRVNTDYNNSVIGFGQANRNSFTFTAYNVQGATLSFILRNITIWRYVGSSENAEQEQATQEQSEAGDSAADSSADDVSNATQSLASAMGSIVSVIKDTPASDCNISISTTGSSAGFTSAIGALNLCSGVPSNILNTIRGLAALVIVPYVLYAAYSICIKMYRTFTEVQNT